MVVSIEGVGELKLWFRYGDEQLTKEQLVAGRIPRELTEAHCVLDNDLKTGFRASAACAAQDVFVKATGRKVALARLLRLCGSVPGLAFTREHRSKIWAAYFAQHGDLRRNKK